MKVNLPDRAKIEATFSDEELLEFIEGVNSIDLVDWALRAIELTAEELSLRPYQPLEDQLGYEPSGFYVPPDTLKALNIPMIMLIIDDDGWPSLCLRLFSEDGVLRSESKCNLVNVAGYFAGKALGLINDLKKSGTIIPDQDVRLFVIRKTANMLNEALHKLPARINLALDSFLEEVWWDWAGFWYEYHAEFNSLQGTKMGRLPIAKAREDHFKKHLEDIRSLWRDASGDELSSLKKQLLALNYKKIFEHWKEIERMQIARKEWRRYVRAGDMEDITDDLIEQFEQGGDLSRIALEQAARRAGLFNIYDVRERRLEKRRQGIKDSGYSRAMLFRLKSEGERLLKNKYETQSIPEQDE